MSTMPPPSAIPNAQPHTRVDGWLKVTGQARYAAEYKFPGLTYGVLVQSTVPKGRIMDIDTAAAGSVPGVVGILTHRNMPRLAPPPDDEVGQGKPGEPYAPLQDDAVHWSGQHIAVVVAGTLEQAQHAASLVRVRYEETPPALDFQAAQAHATEPELWAGREKLQVRRGDAAAALAKAETVVRATYETPIQNHNPIETVNTTAFWEAPDKLVLHDTTRGIQSIRKIVSHAFGLAPANVRVLCPYLGGAFGAKGFQWQHILLAAAAARLVDRPVRVEFTREQMFTTAGRRARTVQNLALGATHQGLLNAVRHETLTATSPLVDYTEPAGNLSRNLYTCPHVEVTHRLAVLNQPSPCPMRAPGEAPGAYALECAMDELAVALQMDPLELRRRNYADRDEHERKPYGSKHLRECYQQAAARFGWARRNPAPRSMRSEDGRLLVGWGMATAAYPAKQMPAAARAILWSDGRLVVRAATHEIGTGTYTGMTQIAAAAMGVGTGSVRFELGDSEFPQAPVNGGSWLTSSVGPAVLAACAALKAKLAELAAADPGSPLAGAKLEELVFADGRVSRRDDPSRGLGYAEVLTRARLPLVEADGSAKPDEESEKEAHVSFGAHFAEVTVDPDLGEVRLRRFVGVYDPGRVLNPTLARSQLYGGVIFGLSMALQEASHPDPHTGRTMNANLGEYHVPVSADMPAAGFDVGFIDQPDETFAAGLGTRGIGELGIVGSAAAVANAVYHATGRRVRDLPITVDKLL